jgi:hypothetical protein
MSRRLVLFTPGHTEKGGVGPRSRLMAEGLSRRGWEVKVVTRAGALHWPVVRSAPAIKVVELPGFGRRRLGAVLFLFAAVPMGVLWGIRASALISVQLMSTTTAAGVCSVLLRRPYLPCRL